ncbi:MAG: hypothetical protein ACYCZF_07000 [Anaerolineae bacterium]
MSWQTATLADCFGDCVVYRNLEPAQANLSGLRANWTLTGLDHYAIPRKGTPEHAAFLYYLLGAAQRARGCGEPLRLLVIGDTLSGDGAVATQLGQKLPTWCFIGHEQPALPASLEIKGRIVLSTRWQGLRELQGYLDQQRFVWDSNTVLLLDIDKSLMGARGRNDKVIDAARVAAVRGTMCQALGESFAEPAFRELYDALNLPAHHGFTADNQDYLAYICLMAIGGVFPVSELWQALGQGDLTLFTQFVQVCESRRNPMTSLLAQAHDEVCFGIANEDPTPFKGFRHAEYLQTVQRMNILPAEAEVSEVLAKEIVITAEVLSLARYAVARGALVMGISDKPDEASYPLPEQAALGYKPLHRTPMKVYGASVV